MLYIAGLARGYQLPKTPYLSFLRKWLQLLVSWAACGAFRLTILKYHSDTLRGKSQLP
jgi:hypothetical protein